MITVVTGIRDLSPESYPDVEMAVVEEVADASEVRFGGAIGSDTVALAAACDADPFVMLRAFVPWTLADQPSRAREVLQLCARDIVELRLPRKRWAPIRRNERMLAGADRVLAFTDGRTKGGTASTIRKARTAGLEVVEIPVRSLSSTTW